MTMQVPQGTPQEQVAVIEKQGRKVVQEELQKIFRTASDALPVSD